MHHTMYQNGISPQDTSPDEIIVDALFRQDYPKFSVTLEQGDCSQKALDKCLAFAAASQGCGNFSELLLREGASVQNYLNGRLVRWSAAGNIEKMQRWIKGGADIHHSNEQPLRAAIIADQPDARHYLEKLGCDFRKAMSNSKTFEWKPRSNAVIELAAEVGARLPARELV